MSDPRGRPHEAAERPPPRSKWALAPVALLLAASCGVAALYRPSLENDYYLLDSRFEILLEPILETHDFRLSALHELLFQGRAHGGRRGLPRLTFALQIGLRGHDLVALRFVNILLHLLVGALIFLLCEETLRFRAFAHIERNQRWIPLTTAVLWLVHPVQIQSVAYIMQRAAVMAALFCVLSLFVFARLRRGVKGRQRPVLIVLCVACGAVACWCKMNAVILPVLMYLYDWFVVRDLEKRSRREVVAVSILAATAVGAYVFYALRLHEYPPWLTFTVSERCLTQFRALWHYVSLVFYAPPSRLNFDVFNDYPLSRSLLNPPTTALALLGLVALLVGSVMIARRWRLLSLGVLMFFAALSIESSMMMMELFKESRLYLPLALLLFGLVATFFQVVRSPMTRVAVPVVAVAVLTMWTGARMRVWTHPILLHEDALAKSPGNYRNLSELGRIYACHERYADALPLLEAASKAPAPQPFWLEDPGRAAAAIKAQAKLAEVPDDREAHWQLAEALGPEGFSCAATLGPRLKDYFDRLNAHLRVVEAHRLREKTAAP